MPKTYLAEDLKPSARHEFQFVDQALNTMGKLLLTPSIFLSLLKEAYLAMVVFAVPHRVHSWVRLVITFLLQ